MAKAAAPWTGLARRLTGPRLCYGKPVTAGERTVIPVARIRVRGGGGYGHGSPEAGASEGSGGGGGGWLDGQPVGFIEIGPEGTRFERIAERSLASKALLGAAVAAAAVVVTGAAGAGGAGALAARALRRRPARRRKGLPSLPSPRRSLPWR